MKIYLDDRRDAPDGWVLVRTFEEFVASVKSEFPEEISFDHDLENAHYGGDYCDRRTGYDALLFLLSWCVFKEKKSPIIHLHTASIPGRERMENLLKIILI